jgi:hypothetical protein
VQPGERRWTLAKKKPQQKKEKKKLKLDKLPLEDLPLREKEEQDVKGGMAPPYVPVGPQV